jgi:hypothetical protein
MPSDIKTFKLLGWVKANPKSLKVLLSFSDMENYLPFGHSLAMLIHQIGLPAAL